MTDTTATRIDVAITAPGVTRAVRIEDPQALREFLALLARLRARGGDVSGAA